MRRRVVVTMGLAAEPGRRFEHSKSHYAGPHPLGAGRGLGDYGGRDAHRLCAVPGWLVILVVSRDIMIVSAVILSWLVDKPVPLKPLLVSKLNTVAQIALACVIMAARGFEFDARIAGILLMALVTALTLISIAFYVAEWVRHMNAAET